jgi:DinB superfamily
MHTVTPAQLALDTWNIHNKRLVSLIHDLTDEQLSAAIAPGKNTGQYLLGHLVAVSDGMLPLLGIGDRIFPELAPIFLQNPDQSGLEKTPIATLKTQLEAVNQQLTSGMAQFTESDWMGRHTAVSEADFAKEPHRNKLNLLLSRTTHLAYHLGQMALLKG